MTDRSAFFASQGAWMKKAMYGPGEGETLTIRDVRDHAFTNKDGSTERKLVLDWKEERPSLTLNKTNFNWLVSTFGGDDDKWVRQRVRVFHDPTITYGGQRIGGLVLEAAPEAPAQSPAGSAKGKTPRGPDPDLRRELNKAQQEAQAQEDLDDDVPF